MNWEEEKLKEFEKTLERFSRFLRGNIQRFDPQRKGLDPDDILQEVKMKIWKVLNDEKQIKNLSSYIKKIVDSSVIDHLRRLRREEGIIFSEKQKKISDRKIRYEAEHPYSNKLKEMVDQALDSLLESRQKAVKLFLLNLSIEEIAISLGWTKDKTRNLLYRGLADLKKKLKEKGIQYEN